MQYEHNYGSVSGAKGLSQIVFDLIDQDKTQALLYKENVVMDVESIHEAVTEACIQLGLDDESFAPSIHDMGHEIEIRLY